MTTSQNNNFDWEVYMANYPELLELQTEQDALSHFHQVGQHENRTDEVPDIFDAEKYAKSVPQLSLKTLRDAYIHFMKKGLALQNQQSHSPYENLFRAQYHKILKHNQSALHAPATSLKPFVLPPRPKIVPKTIAPHSQGRPKTPSILSSMHEPPKTLRPKPKVIENHQPSKVPASVPSIAHKVHNVKLTSADPRKASTQQAIAENVHAKNANIGGRVVVGPVKVHPHVLSSTEKTSRFFSQNQPRNVQETTGHDMRHRLHAPRTTIEKTFKAPDPLPRRPPATPTNNEMTHRLFSPQNSVKVPRADIIRHASTSSHQSLQLRPLPNFNKR